jgi:hypothetical protein
MRRPDPTRTKLEITLPRELSFSSQVLIQRFANAIGEKMRAAELKYGYSDGWRDGGWEWECRKHLREHLEKGDPRDVAIYAAFMWHHGWSTVEPTNAAVVCPGRIS